ncbi:MAG: DUF5654 family protein [Patescibacteria group bacterium]
MKETVDEIKKELSDKMMTYITAAFGLVVGLAWNEAIKSLIEFLFPLEKNTLLAKFIYAAVLTIVFVSITTYVTRILRES